MPKRERDVEELVYGRFEPLVRKLSGVENMFLMTGKGRNILLLGERHHQPYCRDKGYLPLSQIIMEYLEKAHYVDFMLERQSESAHYRYATTAEQRQQTRKAMETYANMDDKPSNPDILNQLRALLGDYIGVDHDNPVPHSRYATFPRARVHWLDPHFRQWKHHPSEADELLRQLSKFVYADTHMLMSWPEIKTRYMLIRDYLGDSPHEVFDHLDAHIQMILETILASKHFHKCRSGIPMEHYITVVRRKLDENLERMKVLDHANHPLWKINVLLFTLQRFLMDVYTCCRIMKQDAEERWYKHMVVYAGASHTENIRDLLELNGFTTHIPDIEHNPTCS